LDELDAHDRGDGNARNAAADEHDGKEPHRSGVLTHEQIPLALSNIQMRARREAASA
jgi:hypothetical protein